MQLLNAVLSDGLAGVEAACAEGLQAGVHSSDAILKMLARQRQPAPPEPLAAPLALYLRHEPLADCAV
ncbi:MAG: hypothetical protein JO227_06940 [Acetobacteraceae bacterium]|nr:hypothetical protein [Acetobacteraceae bacterium]